jgi:hypothetical protein
MSRYPAVRAALKPLAARWRSVELIVPLLVVLGTEILIVVPSVPDTGVYHRYAHLALNSPLLHSLPKEYPAVALAIFLFPLLLPIPYLAGFILLTAVATVALLLCSDGLPAYPGWNRRTGFYLLIGAVAVVLGRYDIFPALATFLAVEAARRDKWGKAWAWAVAGGLLKLFPFLLLPGFLFIEHARTGRWAFRRAAATCVPVTLFAGIQNLLSPGSVLSPVRYELKRGFELESLGGGLTMLADPLHVSWRFAYGGWEIFGRYHNVISILVLIPMIAGILAIWHFAARGRLSVEATSLAVLSVSVLGDKAFSPQYLIWLAPLWAYWPLRRGWVASAALTTLVYPLGFIEAGLLGPGYYFATGTALVRNVVLIIATTSWAIEQVRARGTNVVPMAVPTNVALQHEYAGAR